MNHSCDERMGDGGRLEMQPQPTPTMIDATAGGRRRCCAQADEGADGALALSSCAPGDGGASCRHRFANGRRRDGDVHRRKRRRAATSTRQFPRMGRRLFAILFGLITLGFIGCASALDGRAAASSERSLQLWSSNWTGVPCEERPNKGQCEKDALGNQGDIECLWTGDKCITLPLPGVTRPTPPPSGSPAPSPSLPQDGVPTPRPTALPTPQPTRRPSELPSSSPSEVPTLRPTRKPTMSPSRSPSKQPTPPPTDRPTKRPTTSPSAVPSLEPSGSPSGVPSASPTYRPSPSPSQNPTVSSKPTPLIWPSASPSSSAYPTTDPSTIPTMPPSVEPSSAPSWSPTPNPTQSPTRKPSPATSPPTRPANTAPSSLRPTDHNRIYTVESVMKLNGLGEEMDRDAEEAWIDVTEDRIRYETSKIVGDAGSDLVVRVSIDEQEASSGRRMKRTLITKYGSFAFDDTQQQHGNNLRRLQSSSLEINYTTTILFNSEEEWDDQANDMVANGFRTPAQQEEYINLLQAADGSTFDSVNSMTLEVDGELVTQTEDSSQLKPVDNTLWYAVGGAVGGALLLLAAVVGGTRYYGRRRGGNHAAPKQGSKNKPSVPQDRTASGAFPSSPPREAFHPQSSQPTPSPTQGYFGTIESREGEDDVSTLGDPYFGEGIAEPRTDQTVAESMISSQQEMYVFGVGRERLMTGGSSTAPSRHGMESTITGGTHSNPSKMTFGDGDTLEELYRSPEYGGDAPSMLQRLSVVAPSGKLGFVIDNQTGDVPMVHAIKETSPLHGKVNVGDLLISVDGIDCRGMTGVQVSRLISSRSHHPVRTLILLRGTGSC